MTGQGAAAAILDTPSSILAGELPLVEELVPQPDVWQVFQSLAGLPHALFLDSALGHPLHGRYSFIAADPFDWIMSRGPHIVVGREAKPLPETDPFSVLTERLGRWHSPTVPGLPPFQGGAAGLFGYDLCHHLERLPRPRFDEFEVPDLAIGFYDWVVAWDNERGQAWLITTGFPEIDPRRRRRHAQQRLRQVKGWLAGGSMAARESAKKGDWQSGSAALGASHSPTLPLSHSPTLSLSHSLTLPLSHSPTLSLSHSPTLPSTHSVLCLPGLLSNFSQAAYLEAVRRAIEYIHSGDCFQVNLSHRLLYPAVVPPLELYRRLRQRNPAPFAGYFDLGDFVIASASPEGFLRVAHGKVETRPIKGTRPRGATTTEDQANIQELLHSGKDRAENVMIVDLLRNDLGRVCRYGSVQVAAVCRLETYPFVHHLVSEVRGQLRDGLGPVDLLRAAFPGGSVTGAPKIRAMEIIAELEPTARGPYCGSLGYIGFDGSMDTNILIRTFTVGRGWMQFPVGGGIVADSVPQREYEETWHKAEGMLRALR